MKHQTKTINIVENFSSRPYGRYTKDVLKNEEDTTGEKFRTTILIPALKEYEKVHVILTGYNRYGISFLDESFGELIRTGGFTLEELNNKLTYEHADVKSIEQVISDRLLEAENDRLGIDND